MSSIVCNILTKLFFNQQLHDFSKSGVNIECQDGTRATIFADLYLILADEAALHAIYGCKGSSGLKPCLLCTNVFDAKKPRGIVSRDPTGRSVDHTCASVKKSRGVTQSVVAAIVRRLTHVAATSSSTVLKELQTDIGWNFVPGGIMFDAATRVRCCPTKCACFDWAHVFFVNGVFKAIAGLCLHAFRRLNLDLGIVAQYVNSFNWPHAVAGNIAPSDVFTPSRLENALGKQVLRCTASEGLSLLPVLAAFCEPLSTGHPNPAIRAHAECFLLLALVVSMVLRSIRGFTDVNAFKDRAQRYLERFKELYGSTHVVPKHHYVFHLVSYLLRMPFLPNCLVHERKHKGIKRFANAVFNTHTDWDKSVLQEFSCLHISRLISTPAIRFSAAAGLEHCSTPSRRLLSVIQTALGPFTKEQLSVGRTARVNEFEKVSVGDVVLIGVGSPPIIGEIVMHVAISDSGATELVSIIKKFKIESEGDRFWKCVDPGETAIVSTGDIDTAAIWAGVGVITVLKPLHATRSLAI